MAFSRNTGFNSMVGVKPSEEMNSAYIYCDYDGIRAKYNHVKAWGKWMMFFKNEFMDEKWESACELYRLGKLTGISHMKVTTAYRSSRNGVIYFYCGPAHDESTMMEYGKKLLEVFPYESLSGFMFYKSDEQTRRRNGEWLYQIPIGADKINKKEMDKNQGGNGESK